MTTEIHYGPSCENRSMLYGPMLMVPAAGNPLLRPEAFGRNSLGLIAGS